MLQHPVRMIRDTARYAPYMRPRGRNGGKLKPRSLRELAKEYLGLEIQGGKHDSVRPVSTSVSYCCSE
jgi:RNA exonuclease 4